MSTDPLAWLDDAAERRRAFGVQRTIRARPIDDHLIDLASNDYLGLTRHPEVIAGAELALRRWGAGSTGSRLVTGTTEEHEQLERELAEFTGAPSALVFASGYSANLGVVTALSNPDTLIVSDTTNHASLVDACRLSKARVVITPHRDLSAMRDALEARDEQHALVLTDSVFSADGDLAPLRGIHALCRESDAVLIADEAHGIGVRGTGGRGLVQECGLAGEPDIIITMTLSKAFGSQGGAVLADDRIRDHLVNTARSFIFDTGLAPASVGAARAALSVLKREPHLAETVLRHARVLAEAADVAETPESAVVSVVLGDAATALAAADRCRELGVRVGCFRPPSVPRGTSRLRLTARADLTADELDTVVNVLRTVVGEHA
ncbi:8-amino-7-oxononanoate synthase [Hoyosella rhizosphaerae]|uniref:8-amino-7-oxononanoate synthase n=1 Tax=Hoyosella rhizosphaerae TaxID=1755582 RepID=A0A916UEU0_9ACTN|nr:8-amino-7-oxononanoate synthase [Hoyosella rhizosphaerae]MBN4927887.1 8-amino-7-oxononanoate synthase [Hoyosella rhizosphaerae]GGC70732.1 8-amino-7-oxononanoate synthase [Hoyosella rhizosphaerae]